MTYKLLRIQDEKINALPADERRTQRSLHVVLDNDTRWLSQLFMIRRALKLRPYIELMIVEFKHEWEQENRSKRTGSVTQAAIQKIPRILKEENQLTANDWAVLEHLEEILTLFEATVIQLEGDGHVRQRKHGFTGSYGNIWEVLQGFEFLLGELEHFKAVANDFPDPEHFRVGINLAWDKLDEYYNKCDNTSVYYAAIALHPAYRWGWFESTWEHRPDWVEKAKHLVQEVWDEKYRNLDIVAVEKHAPKRRRTFKNPFQEHVNRSRTKPPASSPLPRPSDDEFAAWQAAYEPGDNEVDDPIEYWHDRRFKYPRLSLMALDFLTVPSMSAECERLFSAAKRMVVASRRNLDADVISLCQVLRSWYRAGIIKDLDPRIASWFEEQEDLALAKLAAEEVEKRATAWIRELPPQTRELVEEVSQLVIS